MTLNDLLIDKRIVQRNIEQGKLDTAQYQKMLDALPDLSDKVWRRSEAGSTQSSGNVAKKPVLHSTSVLQPPERLQASPGFDQPGSADELDSDEFDADDDELDADELADDELETDELETDELETDELEADELEAGELEGEIESEIADATTDTALPNEAEADPVDAALRPE